MNWWVRVALWASLLALPCWWLSDPYQHGLAQIAEGVLSIGGVHVEIDEIDLFAPWDLAFFIAMCLASWRAPWAARRRALLIGGAALVALEVGLIALGVVMLMQPASTTAASGQGSMVSHVFATVPWVAAGLVWVPLLGQYQLPRDLLDAAAHTPAPPRR